MSQTTHSLMAGIVAAGAVLTASLIAPAAASAQTGAPERALLNYTVAISRMDSPHVASDPSPIAYPIEWDQGERALLGRKSAQPIPAPYKESKAETSWFSAVLVNGERALLGQWTEQ
jgi:hypothetical protein